MIPFHNAMSIVGESGKTYEQFLDYLTSRGAAFKGFASVVFGAAGTWSVEPRNYELPLSGVMGGSSWMTQFEDVGTNASRALQHAFPTRAALEAVVAAEYKILVVTETRSIIFQGAVTRNDFTSTGRGGCNRVITEVVYWDGAQAWKFNPLAGTAPEPFDWIIP